MSSPAPKRLTLPFDLSWLFWTLGMLLSLPIESLGFRVVLGGWFLGNVAWTWRRARTRSGSDALKSQGDCAIANASRTECSLTDASKDDALEDAPKNDETKTEGSTEVEQGRSLLSAAWLRLRQNRLASLCTALLLVLLVACVLHRSTYEIGTAYGCEAPWFLQHFDHTLTDKTAAYQPPSSTHWFGTDALGRDVFARTLYGGSISFAVAIVGTLVALVIGVTWGSVAGYYGGRIDHYMMRFVDVLYGLPFLFLVILIMTLVNGVHSAAATARPHVNEVTRLRAAGDDDAATRYTNEHGVDLQAHLAVFLDEHVPPIVVMFIALGLVQWLTMARIVRGQVLALREREFVLAARLLGASTPRIVLRHLIPNLLGPVTVYATLTVPTVMLLEAFLSFLGLGISEPDCSWGSLAAEGVAALNVLKTYWWLLLYPGAAISLTLFSLNFMGDGLRDALDPKYQ